MPRDIPLDVKGKRIFLRDTVIVVNSAALDRNGIGRVERIYGKSVRYTGTEGVWKRYNAAPPARTGSSLLKVPEDITKDPELLNAFLVLSGFREQRE